VFLDKKRNNNEYRTISVDGKLDEDKPVWKRIKLEGLQVETFTLSYKVFQLFGGLSKSVSPDEDREPFLAIYTKFVLRAKFTCIFDKIKNDNNRDPSRHKHPNNIVCCTKQK
jgi:hypothetical protein